MNIRDLVRGGYLNNRDVLATDKWAPVTEP